MTDMDTYVYLFGENLYVNLTNRCCNDCTFCLRNNGDGVGGNNLWLSREPQAHEVIALIAAYGKDSYRDIVFCGYGEPTYAVEKMLEIADYAHSVGKKTRLNTNGLGNLINGRDIVPLLAGRIDVVSVSLNESTEEKYDEICRPAYKDAFAEVKRFAAECAAAGISTVLSVVDVIGEKAVEECRRIVREEIPGATLRVRKMVHNNDTYD